MSNKTIGNNNCIISPIRRKRFQIQGYDRYTDSELYDYRLGLRFAYFLCGSLVLLGIIFENLWILAAAFIIAFFGSFLLRHPFDYLYNYAIRHLIHKPVLPFKNGSRTICLWNCNSMDRSHYLFLLLWTYYLRFYCWWHSNLFGGSCQHL